MQEQERNEKNECNLAPDCNVFLVTGELPSPQPGQSVIALGYVVADHAQQAVNEQVKAQPTLKVTGVVSLMDLKRHVDMLEAARAGRIPVLVCGSWCAP